MNGVNTDSRIIQEAIDICNRAIEILRATQKGMISKYTEAGENWNDSKYHKLGEIVGDCDSTINKALVELDDCIAPLMSLDASIQEYLSVNISGISDSSHSDIMLSTPYNQMTNIGGTHNNGEHLGLFPTSLAGVVRGEPMTRYEANHKKPNPNYSKGGGYKSNCQTCVVAYEARLRGYNVSALPNTEGSRLAELSHYTNRAWIDPETGRHPDYIVDNYAVTPERYARFLELTTQHNERYTLEFCWPEREEDGTVLGHIISLDRDENGNLRLYDPQTGTTRQGTEIERYLRGFEYSVENNGQLLPRIMRIDNMEFNTEIIDNVLEVTNNG